MTAARILVVGSINIDLVVSTARLPAPGETVTGGTFLRAYGGKGANQAVAARRLGAEVRMIGGVGNDAFGTELRQALHAEGIDVGGVTTFPDTASGTALIMVDAAGRNQIAVASGANLRLRVEHVAPYASAFAWAQVVLCQLEVPLETVRWTLQMARQHGVITVLNPAPGQLLPVDMLALVDYLTPNEIEAAQLSGMATVTLANAPAVAQALRAQGPAVVLVTLGAEGVVASTSSLHVPACPVSVVDTTAAGDAFSGALAVALAEGQPLEAAVRFATATAGLACTQRGAQPSLPHREAVEAVSHVP